MTIRVDGHDVPLDADPGDAFPEPSADFVVFVHGLCETERAWWLRAEDTTATALDPRLRLAAEIGATPVYLRYNTGLHISDNGEQLAALLDDLVANWPVEVTRLTLVGHSMGGLVIRSACCRGQEAARVGRAGPPHRLPRLAASRRSARGRRDRAGVALRKLPETRPLATALASRSVGIKDLRYGDIRPDWADIRDPDAWRGEPADCAPLLESAEHYYIGATLTRSRTTRRADDRRRPRHVPERFRRRPARQLALDIDRGRHLGGLHHFDLLNHPRVWALLELAGRRRLTPAQALYAALFAVRFTIAGVQTLAGLPFVSRQIAEATRFAAPISALPRLDDPVWPSPPRPGSSSSPGARWGRPSGW